MNLNEIKSSYTNIDWLKKNCQKLHYFGLGFIQLKLTPNYRLHFYTEKLPPIIGDEDIHDHRYSFNSYILRGKFTQHLFEITDGNQYILEYESCSEGNSSDFIRYCDFTILNSSTYSQGSNYFIHGDTFHRVEATDCITLLERPTLLSKEKARVGRLVGTPKVCPFSKKIPESELWNIIADELILHHHQGDIRIKYSGYYYNV